MSNPHHHAVDDALRMQPVVVITDHGRYEGVLERRDHHSGDVLLRGATYYATAASHGEHLGASWIESPDAIREQNPEELHRLTPERLQASPYHHREFEPSENQRYIREVREQGHVDSIITAHRTDDERPCRIVAGHKRRWVAMQAELEHLTVEIVDYSDWQAAWAYADDHLHALEDDVLRETLGAYASEWGERAHDIPVVDEAAMELGVDLTDDGLQQVEPGRDDASEPSNDGDDDPVEAELEELEETVDDDSDADVERDDELLAVEIDGEPVGLPLDHTDEEHLEWAFEREHSMMAASEWFDVSYATVRDRFIDTGLHKPVGSATLSEAEDDEDADSDEAEDDEEIWCGVCGEGPFDSVQQVGGHHNGAGHEGETRPEDEPPEKGEGRSEETEEDHVDADRETQDDPPDTWDDAWTDPPEDLPHQITPKQLREAANEHDTLYAISNEFRSPRSVVKTALNRLGLLRGLDGVDAGSRNGLDGIEEDTSLDGEYDDEPVEFEDWSADPGDGRRCQNCGSHLDKKFTKIFEPEDEGAPRCCPNCEELIRDHDGEIREARSTRQNDDDPDGEVVETDGGDDHAE